MKKMISLILVLMMVTSLFAGCSKEAKNEVNADGEAKTETTKTDKTSDSSDGEESNDVVTVKMAIDPAGAEGAEIKAIKKLLADHGIELELVIVPLPEDGEADKLLINLMAGDSFDLIYSAESNMKPFYNAGVMENMDVLAKEYNYDLDQVFGDYQMDIDGVTYAAPAFVDIAMTMYNKDLFDKNGIDYPDANGWTWEKYVEIGKKITDEENGNYGSFMPDWVHYNYMYAMQKGASHYKEDGTANYDDPVFKEALEFYYGLGNVEKIQPDFLTHKSKQLPIDLFMTGNVGMYVIGGWATVFLNDADNYPRDWRAGITVMPSPEGYEKSTSTVVGGYWVPTTSTNKEAAFKAATLLAEKQYTLGFGRIPARIDLSDEEVGNYIENNLLKAFPESDGITVEDIKNVWFNTEIKPFTEKVMGPGSVGINNAFVEEGELYAITGQDIDVTMKNIQKKANKAINDELNK